MDTLGRIAVPDILPTSVFPVTSDMGAGLTIEPEIKVHTFGSGNAKMEQRFVLGNGYKKFSVKCAGMSKNRVGQLADFWELNKGIVGAFTYNSPDGTSPICRFADTKLTFEYLMDDLASSGVVLQQLPTTTPYFPLNQTVERFPNGTLANALLDNTQVIFPLIRIRVLEQAVPDIFLSDRRVTVGPNTYQARLLSWDGISQSIDGSADQAAFTFGNADRVMTKLKNDTILRFAAVEFSLYHVGTGIKIDLWKGFIQNWKANAGPEFKVSCVDGVYELGLPYPARKIARSCWKMFKGPQCPYSGGETVCNKSWEDCKYRSMQPYFGGIIGNPQTVNTKDNSTGIIGYGRNSLQSSSVVSDSVYSEVLADVWYNDGYHPLAVNAKVIEGRDEGDFYCALGVVGRGPLGSYTPFIYDRNSVVSRNNPIPTWHTLDGLPPHGPYMMGLRQCLGDDPVRNMDPDGNSDRFSLGEGGSGIQTYTDQTSAGVAFVEIRRKDDKGLQLQPLSEHAMRCYVSRGLSGLVWTAPGVRSLIGGCNNPIWVAVNCLLMAKGLWTEDMAFNAKQEAQFDVGEAIKAAAVCDQMVSLIVPRNDQVWTWDTVMGTDIEGNPIEVHVTGTWSNVPITEEKQFVFQGAMTEQKPLRQWFTEILNNCLGFYTFSFGKLRFGVRFNCVPESAFTLGNILFNSLETSDIEATFNRFTATFGDVVYDFAANSCVLYDADQAQFLGGATTPTYLDGNMNLSGTTTMSRAARLVTARLREEVGGIGLAEQTKACDASFKTTILALEVFPGMVCSLDHPDLAGGTGKMRVQSWKLNSDYSIDLQAKTVTDTMYNMLVGDLPKGVSPDPVPTEIVFAPADFSYHLDILGDGKVSINNLVCATNPTTVHEGTFDIYYVAEENGTLCSLTSGSDAITTDMGYTGDPPVTGEWTLADAEVMEVVSVTPGAGAGTFTVKRAQFGTVAAAHQRVTSPITNPSPNNAEFDTTGIFEPGNLMVVSPAAAWGIIASYDGTHMTTTLPMDTLAGQTEVYSDPRIYRVVRKTVVIPFAPRFFTSGARAEFTYPIELAHAGIVCCSAFLENTRGVRSDPVFVAATADYPHRVRTFGNSPITMVHPVPPQGLTDNAFFPVTLQDSQSCTNARAEWVDTLYIPTPSAITSPVPASAAFGGTITISSAVARPKGSILVQMGEKGVDENYISLPEYPWVGNETVPLIAQDLMLFLHVHEEFSAFFDANQILATGRIELIDKTGRGGKLIVTSTGEITVVATGMATPMGIKIGRKYAVTFFDGTHEGYMSPASPSTGPAGGSARVDLTDLPSTTRADVTTLRIWATPDGKEGPFYLVGTVPNGTGSFSDATLESALLTQTRYYGPSQPSQDGSCTIDMKKNGYPWFQLRLVNGFSNQVEGLALGAISQGTSITADVTNSLAEGELRIFIN